MLRQFMAVLLAATAGSAAQADVRWFVTGTFDDGASLSGWFDINQYGFLSGAKFWTGTGSTFTGKVYASPGMPANNDDVFVGIYPDAYEHGLELRFTTDLNVGVTSNALLTTSLECRNDFCTPGRSLYRYVTSGYATTEALFAVPEPESWALLIGGFALAGGTLRARRVRATLA